MYVPCNLSQSVNTFFLQAVATHPSHHRNLQQQPCCITSNVAQACASNTICGWVCEQVCHPSTYGPGNWPTQPLSHHHRLFEKQCWSSRTGLHHDKNSGTLELCTTSSHFCLGFWLQVQNNVSTASLKSTFSSVDGCMGAFSITSYMFSKPLNATY